MDVCWLEDKRRKQFVLLAVFLLIPVILYAVPLDWLKGQHTICLYKNITGNDCYGCGITRALFSVIHLKFADALKFNKLILIVFPILVYIWVKKIVNLWPGKVK